MIDLNTVHHRQNVDGDGDNNDNGYGDDDIRSSEQKVEGQSFTTISITDIITINNCTNLVSSYHFKWKRTEQEEGGNDLFQDFGVMAKGGL